MLSNAVSSHFDDMKEEFGIFLKKLCNEAIFKIFLEDTKEEHVASLESTEEGIEALKAELIELETEKAVRESYLNGIIPDEEQIKIKLTEQIDKRKRLDFTILKDAYKNAKGFMDIIITGESQDIKAKIESLSNLYTILSQQGQTDKAEKILARAMSLAGENYYALIGFGDKNANKQGSIQNMKEQVQNLTGQQPTKEQLPIKV